jgi:hypothetical protein
MPRVRYSLHVAALLLLTAIAFAWRAPEASRVPAAPARQAQSRSDELASGTFRLRYDAAGIRSLRRVDDVHDTDYIAPGGALGRLVVRYRTAPHGDWRELRDLTLTSSDRSSVLYALGAAAPGLASRASPSVERGVGGLRALNDGLVPASPGARRGGRGRPPLAEPAADAPQFTWTPGANAPGAGGPGEAGDRRWVQYTFVAAEDVARTDVFWVAPPRTWRLRYLDGREWRDVAATGPFATTAGAFTTVAFAPVKTTALRIEITMPPSGGVSLAEWRVGPPPAIAAPGDLAVSSRFALAGAALDWTIAVTNRGARPVEIGDLGLPLEFAERAGARGEIYTRKLMRHALVAGHGSWVLWQRSNGVGPFLAMIPNDATKLEYFDSTSGGAGAFTPFVHGAAARAEAVAAGGDWRLPTGARSLAPQESVRYAFRFEWVDDVAAFRDALVAAGGVDVVVAPGMVVPADLDATFAIRTRAAIRSIDPEHPARTRLAPLGEREGGARVYRVEFSHLGENLLTVRYADGRWSTLEFFVTEPLETVIRKRAAFLAARQQHTDPSKWYVGAYGDWDQRNEVLRGPEDRDGLSSWLTDANDDAGNARPAFLASKNVFFPEAREIASLELYVSRYLWGGMQMTGAERFPYAIYGVPNWQANRASPDPGRNGQAHVWRIYDYPHVALLYYRMYQIATRYPERIAHLDAATYLERAYRTARAYWTVPLAVEKWSADAVGTMNEAFLPELIDALEEEGRVEWADALRTHWEGKVDRFVNRTPNLYGSEFAFDSTGFESTGALARYALTRDAPEFRARVSREAAARFMALQLRLNMTDRGWPETTYYQLGSDYRGNLSYLLSYMSQLGGWAILDYALHVARDPTDYLRLGYASSLSSWALVNSGTAESGYGYWFPSPANDGAAGGGFMPEARGRAWIGKPMRRGAWHYSAEQDVGFTGALRAHATILARDPILGEIAYGGVVTRSGTTAAVVPRDGLRVRFHVVRGDQRLHLVLERDGFARERPIAVRDDLSRIEFALENRRGGPHEARLAIAGLPEGRYDVTVDGRQVATLAGATAAQRVRWPAGDAPVVRVAIERGR